MYCSSVPVCIRTIIIVVVAFVTVAASVTIPCGNVSNHATSSHKILLGPGDYKCTVANCEWKEANVEIEMSSNTVLVFSNVSINGGNLNISFSDADLISNATVEIVNTTAINCGNALAIYSETQQTMENFSLSVSNSYLSGQFYAAAIVPSSAHKEGITITISSSNVSAVNPDGPAAAAAFAGTLEELKASSVTMTAIDSTIVAAGANHTAALGLLAAPLIDKDYSLHVYLHIQIHVQNLAISAFNSTVSSTSELSASAGMGVACYCVQGSTDCNASLVAQNVSFSVANSNVTVRGASAVAAAGLSSYASHFSSVIFERGSFIGDDCNVTSAADDGIGGGHSASSFGVASSNHPWLASEGSSVNASDWSANVSRCTVKSTAHSSSSASLGIASAGGRNSAAAVVVERSDFSCVDCEVYATSESAGSLAVLGASALAKWTDITVHDWVIFVDASALSASTSNQSSAAAALAISAASDEPSCLIDIDNLILSANSSIVRAASRFVAAAIGISSGSTDSIVLCQNTSFVAFNTTASVEVLQKNSAAALAIASHGDQSSFVSVDGAVMLADSSTISASVFKRVAAAVGIGSACQQSKCNSSVEVIDLTLSAVLSSINVTVEQSLGVGLGIAVEKDAHPLSVEVTNMTVLAEGSSVSIAPIEELEADFCGAGGVFAWSPGGSFRATSLQLTNILFDAESSNFTLANFQDGSALSIAAFYPEHGTSVAANNVTIRANGCNLTSVARHVAVCAGIFSYSSGASDIKLFNASLSISKSFIKAVGTSTQKAASVGLGVLSLAYDAYTSNLACNTTTNVSDVHLIANESTIMTSGTTSAVTAGMGAYSFVTCSTFLSARNSTIGAVQSSLVSTTKRNSSVCIGFAIDSGNSTVSVDAAGILLYADQSTVESTSVLGFATAIGILSQSKQHSSTVLLADVSCHAIDSNVTVSADHSSTALGVVSFSLGASNVTADGISLRGDQCHVTVDADECVSAMGIGVCSWGDGSSIELENCTMHCAKSNVSTIAATNVAASMAVAVLGGRYNTDVIAFCSNMKISAATSNISSSVGASCSASLGVAIFSQSGPSSLKGSDNTMEAVNCSVESTAGNMCAASLGYVSKGSSQSYVRMSRVSSSSIDCTVDATAVRSAAAAIGLTSYAQMAVAVRTQFVYLKATRGRVSSSASDAASSLGVVADTQSIHTSSVTVKDYSFVGDGVIVSASADSVSAASLGITSSSQRSTSSIVLINGSHACTDCDVFTTASVLAASIGVASSGDESILSLGEVILRGIGSVVDVISYDDNEGSAVAALGFISYGKSFSNIELFNFLQFCDGCDVSSHAPRQCATSLGIASYIDSYHFGENASITIHDGVLHSTNSNVSATAKSVATSLGVACGGLPTDTSNAWTINFIEMTGIAISVDGGNVTASTTETTAAVAGVALMAQWGTVNASNVSIAGKHCSANASATLGEKQYCTAAFGISAVVSVNVSFNIANVTQRSFKSNITTVAKTGSVNMGIAALSGGNIFVSVNDVHIDSTASVHDAICAAAAILLFAMNDAVATIDNVSLYATRSTISVANSATGTPTASLAVVVVAYKVSTTDTSNISIHADECILEASAVSAASSAGIACVSTKDESSVTAFTAIDTTIIMYNTIATAVANTVSSGGLSVDCKQCINTTTLRGLLLYAQSSTVKAIADSSCSASLGVALMMLSTQDDGSKATTTFDISDTVICASASTIVSQVVNSTVASMGISIWSSSGLIASVTNVTLYGEECTVSAIATKLSSASSVGIAAFSNGNLTVDSYNTTMYCSLCNLTASANEFSAASVGTSISSNGSSTLSVTNSQHFCALSNVTTTANRSATSIGMSCLGQCGANITGELNEMTSADSSIRTVATGSCSSSVGVATCDQVQGGPVRTRIVNLTMVAVGSNVTSEAANGDIAVCLGVVSWSIDSSDVRLTGMISYADSSNISSAVSSSLNSVVSNFGIAVYSASSSTIVVDTVTLFAMLCNSRSIGRGIAVNFGINFDAFSPVLAVSSASLYACNSSFTVTSENNEKSGIAIGTLIKGETFALKTAWLFSNLKISACYCHDVRPLTYSSESSFNVMTQMDFHCVNSGWGGISSEKYYVRNVTLNSSDCGIACLSRDFPGEIVYEADEQYFIQTCRSKFERPEVDIARPSIMPPLPVETPTITLVSYSSSVFVSGSESISSSSSYSIHSGSSTPSHTFSSSSSPSLSVSNLILLTESETRGTATISSRTQSTPQSATMSVAALPSLSVSASEIVSASRDLSLSTSITNSGTVTRSMFPGEKTLVAFALNHTQGTSGEVFLSAASFGSPVIVPIELKGDAFASGPLGRASSQFLSNLLSCNYESQSSSSSFSSVIGQSIRNTTISLGFSATVAVFTLPAIPSIISTESTHVINCTLPSTALQSSLARPLRIVFIVVPLPKPPIIPAEAEEAAKATATVASIGSPGTAVQASRLSMLMSLSNCKADLDELGFNENLLGMKIALQSDEELKHSLGAVVGNTLIEIGAAAAMLLFGAFYYLRKKNFNPEYRFSKALSSVRFPSLLIVPFMFFLEPTVKNCVVVFANGGAAACVISSICLVLHLAVIAGVTQLVLRSTMNTKSFPVVFEQKENSGLLESQGRWRPNIDAGQQPAEYFEAKMFLRKYRFLFTEYNSTGRWFLVVECAFTLLTATLQGLRTGEIVCRISLFVIAAAFIAYLVALLYFTPHSTRFNRWFCGFIAVAQAVCAILTIVFEFSRYDTLLTLVVYVTAVLMFVLTAKTVVEIIQGANDLRARMRRKMLKRQKGGAAALSEALLSKTEDDNHDVTEDTEMVSVLVPPVDEVGPAVMQPDAEEEPEQHPFLYFEDTPAPAPERSATPPPNLLGVAEVGEGNNNVQRRDNVLRDLHHRPSQTQNADDGGGADGPTIIGGVDLDELDAVLAETVDPPEKMERRTLDLKKFGWGTARRGGHDNDNDGNKESEQQKHQKHRTFRYQDIDLAEVVNEAAVTASVEPVDDPLLLLESFHSRPSAAATSIGMNPLEAVAAGPNDQQQHGQTEEDEFALLLKEMEES